MAMARDSNGAMNPFAMPFIPLASPQPTFALRRTRKTRSTVRAARREGGDALSSRGQVMSSEIGQGAHGSPFAHCFASFITGTWCKVSQVHAVANNVCHLRHPVPLLHLLIDSSAIQPLCLSLVLKPQRRLLMAQIVVKKRKTAALLLATVSSRDRAQTLATNEPRGFLRLMSFRHITYLVK